MTTRPRPLAKSRRKPKLRLVGSARESERHATIFTVVGVRHVVEVWSYQEYDALEDWERPADASYLPGLGYIVIRTPHSIQEADDIADLCAQERTRVVALSREY